ncbi:MAG: sulfurtransferase, partial [Planctomycetes bacterium]|nr:sulfurtransferase [Planctomycetota bacterium]
TPWALGLSAFIGCGMIFAGITGNCAMANVLATMPWNRSKSCSGACSV